MKVKATVVFSFQARTLEDAGRVLDDVLARALERDDVEVGGVELLSPPGEHLVTLPAPAAHAGFAPAQPPAGVGIT